MKDKNEKSKVPDNISVNVEFNIEKLCENTGFISLDEDDYKNVLGGAKQTYIGYGHATGERKGVKAARMAAANQFMAMPLKEAAKVLIINTVSVEDTELSDIEDAAQVIIDAAHPDANIIFGAFFDEDMENEMRVDIIATK